MLDRLALALRFFAAALKLQNGSRAEHGGRLDLQAFCLFFDQFIVLCRDAHVVNAV